MGTFGAGLSSFRITPDTPGYCLTIFPSQCLPGCSQPSRAGRTYVVDIIWLKTKLPVIPWEYTKWEYDLLLKANKCFLGMHSLTRLGHLVLYICSRKGMFDPFN